MRSPLYSAQMQVNLPKQDRFRFTGIQSKGYSLQSVDWCTHPSIIRFFTWLTLAPVSAILPQALLNSHICWWIWPQCRCQAVEQMSAGAVRGSITHKLHLRGGQVPQEARKPSRNPTCQLYRSLQWWCWVKKVDDNDLILLLRKLDNALQPYRAHVDSLRSKTNASM